MSPNRSDVERLLSKVENELVTQSKQPELSQLSTADLSELAKRLCDAFR